MDAERLRELAQRIAVERDYRTFHGARREHRQPQGARRPHTPAPESLGAAAVQPIARDGTARNHSLDGHLGALFPDAAAANENGGAPARPWSSIWDGDGQEAPLAARPHGRREGGVHRPNGAYRAVVDRDALGGGVAGGGGLRNGGVEGITWGDVLGALKRHRAARFAFEVCCWAVIIAICYTFGWIS